MYVLHYKFKRLKAELKVFNQTHFGGILTKVADKRKDLALVQEKVLGSPIEELIQLEKTLSLELYDLMLAEECFYK